MNTNEKRYIYCFIIINSKIGYFISCDTNPSISVKIEIGWDESGRRRDSHSAHFSPSHLNLPSRFSPKTNLRPISYHFPQFGLRYMLLQVYL